jgi:hypothetical protein
VFSGRLGHARCSGEFGREPEAVAQVGPQRKARVLLVDPAHELSIFADGEQEVAQIDVLLFAKCAGSLVHRPMVHHGTPGCRCLCGVLSLGPPGIVVAMLAGCWQAPYIGYGAPVIDLSTPRCHNRLLTHE